MSALLRGGLVTLAALWAAGCQGTLVIDPDDIGPECGDRLCRAGELCLDGRCVSDVPCPGGCPSGQSCRGDGCVPSQIECPEEDACEPCNFLHPDGACEAGLECRNAVCFPVDAGPPACATGVDGWCAGELACVDGACVPIDAEDQCSSSHPDGACPGGERCVGGRCYRDVVDCSSSEPDGWCPSEQICNGVQCVDGTGSCSPTFPHGDCPAWFICVEGGCAGPVPPDACSPDYPTGRCPSDEVCVDGGCVPMAEGNVCSPENPAGLCPGDAGCDNGVCVTVTEDRACGPEHPDGLCAGGAVCRNGACTQLPCDAGGYACPPGAWCDGAECVLHPCDPVHPEGTCLDSAATCVSGVCVGPDCSPAHPNGTCPFGFVCRSGACGLADCSPQVPHGVCPTDQVCDAGACVPCERDAQGECEPPCHNDRCGAAQACCPDATPECVGGLTCQARCETERCGSSLSCCAAGTPECVAGQFCQPLCPHPTDTRCGDIGEICCDSTAGLACGPSNRCITDCGTLALCGDGDSSPGFCCAAGEVCVFDACVMPTTLCTSFLDCQNGEYCELALSPPRCMSDDYPDGTPSCQGAATDLFAPEIDWHFLGVRLNGSTWELCEASGDYSGSTCYGNVETAPVVIDLDREVAPQDLQWQSRWAAEPTTFPAGQAYPEVVIKAYRSNNFDDNVVTILDGRDGSLKGVIPGGSRGHIALINLDGDEQIELCTTHNGGLRARDPFYPGSTGPVGPTVCPTLDDNGRCEVLWTNTTAPMNANSNTGAPTTTDLDGDGQAEIVYGSLVLDGQTGAFLILPDTTCDYAAGADPTLGSLMSHGTTGEGPISSVADLDLDGVAEIVSGNKSIELRNDGGGWTCTLEWDAGAAIGADALTAVANFVDNTRPPYSSIDDPALPNDIDYPEVAAVHDGRVVILHGKTGALMPSPADGTTPLAFDLFDQRGGPPNVADFDGDGHVEVSFAGPGCMTVIDPDCAVSSAPARVSLAATPGSGCQVAPAAITACTVDVQAGIGDMIGILWMDETQDQSSAATGTTVFDFQGDGKAEVLYNDECFFRVYDGESGDVLMERPNSHRTATEYPVVVDMDGDSNSEILVASTGDQAITRDCCAGTTDCTTSSRAAYPGAKAYYRSPADLYVLASYDSSFCTCGHLDDADACAIESGCTWDASDGACEVYDCGQHGTSGACDGAARHCQWVSGTCVLYPDTPDQICRRGTWGVWAFGDKQDLWVKTRPQWNQHTFHVTDATLEGEPVADWGPGENNWEVFNNYRQNVQGFAPLNAPDLQVFSLTANLLGCPYQITLNVRVVNRGRAGILAGVPIAFYQDNGGTPVLLGTVPLPYTLLPGQGADVSFVLNVTPGAAPIDVSVIANPPDGASPSFECRADNNEATLFGVECPNIGG